MSSKYLFDDCRNSVALNWHWKFGLSSLSRLKDLYIHWNFDHQLNYKVENDFSEGEEDKFKKEFKIKFKEFWRYLKQGGLIVRIYPRKKWGVMGVRISVPLQIWWRRACAKIDFKGRASLTLWSCDGFLLGVGGHRGISRTRKRLDNATAPKSTHIWTGPR